MMATFRNRQMGASDRPAGQRPTGGRRPATAAVEFAVISPVLFLMLLGVIGLARAFMVVEQLNGAAVAGARAGSLNGATSADLHNAVDAVVKGQGLTDSSGKSLAT